MRVLLCILLITLASCSYASAPLMGEGDRFIQGTWRASGSGGPYGWYLEWTFTRGSFKQDGYPPLHQEGKYKVLKTDGPRLTLKLYDQKGTFGTEDKEMEVVIDREKDKLTIGGQGPFSRGN